MEDIKRRAQEQYSLGKYPLVYSGKYAGVSTVIFGAGQEYRERIEPALRFLGDPSEIAYIIT